MSSRTTGGGLWAALLLCAGFCGPLQAGTVTYSVSLTLPARAISPLVYGGQENSVPGATLRRVGGNRMTGYNWENNASNAGNDYIHNSDYWLLSQVGLPQNGSQGPARFLRARIDQARADSGVAELITLQAAGYVAADGAGVVSAAETAPSARWKAVQSKKGAAFSLAPNAADGTVYMDEEVNYLQSVYGTAAAGGIKYYCIDNEPDLWSSTHVRIHPTDISYVEAVSRTVDLATAVLDVDPVAEVFGFVSYGWSGFRNLQGAPDAATYNPSYSNYFIGYFLAQMQAAQTAQGRRLVHYLDLHWYPEAMGNNAGGTPTRIVFGTGGTDTSPGVNTARVQAPRSLWDTTYAENSWIVGDLGGQSIRLITRIRNLINAYYPGTKLAFTEWQYGEADHISVGLASVDALGIFGRYTDAACYFGATVPYTTSAFKLYLDYDGAGHGFGDRGLTATASDNLNGSVHAAYDSLDPERLTVIVLNKDASLTQTAQVNLGLNGGQSILSIQAWRLGATSSSILTAPAPGTITATAFTASLPPYSATLYEVRLQAVGTPTRTATPTPTFSSSPTRTPSASPTATRSWTLTRTPTVSATGTLSRTSTLTPTQTLSASPSASVSPSLTLSRTATGSPTVTLTLSPSASPSQTLSPTPVLSATPSASVTGTSTLSPVLSPTASPSLTLTRSPTLSATLTPSATLTVTLSASATASPSATLSPVFSPTLTATHTLSFTGTLTATPTPSLTLSATASQTASAATATLTATPSPVLSLTVTLTPSPLMSADGPLVIDALVLAPQPLSSGQGTLFVKLQGPADALECRVYTANLAVSKVLSLSGNFQAGWNQAAFDASGLANGSYFCRVSPLRQGRRGHASAALKLYVAR